MKNEDVEMHNICFGETVPCILPFNLGYNFSQKLDGVDSKITGSLKFSWHIIREYNKMSINIYSGMLPLLKLDVEGHKDFLSL